MTSPRNPHLHRGSSKKEISGAVKQKIRGGVTQLIQIDPSGDQLEKALKKASKIISNALRKYFKAELLEEKNAAEQKEIIPKELHSSPDKKTVEDTVKKAPPKKPVKKLPAQASSPVKRKKQERAEAPISSTNKKTTAVS